MKEKPILFSGPMVRAILEGRKTQTRRIGKLQSPHYTELGCEGAMHATKGNIIHATYRAYPDGGSARWAICEFPYGYIGDRLWVRETFHSEGAGYFYRADWSDEDGEPDWKWTPSIHMPRRASRLTLEIVSVRVERLQDITSKDAVAEGIEPDCFNTSTLWRDYLQNRRDVAEWFSSPIASFSSLWESINGADSWALNPWVWVIEFKRL